MNPLSRRTNADPCPSPIGDDDSLLALIGCGIAVLLGLVGTGLPGVSLAVESAASVQVESQSLWGSEHPAAGIDESDPRPVELGVRFGSERDGLVDAIRFFRAVPIHRGYAVHVWTGKGELLGSARSVEGQQPTPGWQIVQIYPPVSIKAGEQYVASYHADGGRYSFSRNFFTERPVAQGFLRTWGGPNSGVFAYGASGVFPSEVFQSSNYWVDVSFKPRAAQ